MQPATLEGAEGISPLSVVKPLSPAIGGSGGRSCGCIGIGATLATERGAMTAADCAPFPHTTGVGGVMRPWWHVTGPLSPRKNKKGRLRAV